MSDIVIIMKLAYNCYVHFKNNRFTILCLQKSYFALKQDAQFDHFISVPRSFEGLFFFHVFCRTFACRQVHRAEIQILI